MTTPPFNPLPCGPGTDEGGAFDVESNILCDLDAEGTLLGTALAVWTYDENGNPVGPPTFVDPATGDPYVPQGTLQVCPGGQCAPPMQFCQTSTSTGPVEHPGRMYDITLPINPGFAVQSLQVDQVTNAANIVWEVDDPDGEAFRQNLTTFLEGRLPAAAVVTITNPNAGVPQVCGAAAPMQIHIECVRLDQNPPDLIELVYNGGQDMVQNPAYNESPALNPPVSQGNYGFHLLAREDDPGPFPGNPPAGRALCTNTANRGWETNDVGRTFEIWGKDVSDAQNTTPTPRGTPVQEIASDGAPVGRPSTIWQTFVAPASGNFIIRVVHGARDPGEQHRITLDNGDTGDAQNGDLIDDVTNPPSVTSSGGPNPWTQFQQTIPLTSGSTYTLALSVSNNGGGARGGLFTDMRAYIDRPDLRATATTDDETCVVTTEETQTNTTCSFWQPQCSDGRIVGWVKVDTGDVLTNAEFWAQTPTPQCCRPEAAEGGEGSSTLSNLAVSDIVCGQVGGQQTNLIRQVVLDPSGGTLLTTFVGLDGGPVEPSTWTPGPCTSNFTINDQVLCDIQPDGSSVPFLRKYVQSLSTTNQGQVNSFRDFNLEGTTNYTITGTVGSCSPVIPDRDRETVCWTQTSSGTLVHTGTIRHDDTLPAPGWLLFDQNQTPVPPTEPGLTFVPCGQAADPVTEVGLCLADGTPIGVVTVRDADSGVYVQDGWINLLTGTFTSGLPPVGTVACGESRSIQVSGVFCDVDGAGNVLGLVLVEYSYNPDGTIASVRLVNATTGATYVPTGTISVCPTGTDTAPEQDAVVLCDDNGSFVRDFRRDELGAIVGFSDYTLAGAAYAPVGTVRVCSSRDSESVILCDSAATPNRFIRTYTYNTAGGVAGFTDTTLAGAPFVPTGAVGLCTQPTATDLDFAEEVLCDQNGTAFIRRFTFNSSTGAVTATTNLTLAGAAFAPVGTVSVCTTCCPLVLAEGCTNTGSGRYAAMRAANGTITLVDPVSGATVTAANVVTCPPQQVTPTSVTLSAEGRLIGDADAAWSPGADVVGTLTSVTMTVLSGTATVTDASGTVLTGLPAGLTLTWEADDHSTLTGPQSIDAVGGQTVVNWTRK